jgi:proteic killer suppression protein
VKKVRVVLSALDVAKKPESLDIIGMNFHALKGNMTGRYAVTVSKNWPITIAFEDSNAVEIDLEDYHG